MADGQRHPLRPIGNGQQPVTPGGNGFDARLREAENNIVAIKTELKYLATKEDLKDLKIWWLGGIIAGMTSAAIIALAVARLFSS